MQSKVFINIPVRDLRKSMDFYTSIGFENNPMFTDETAAAMVFTDSIYVMLLTHDKFLQFTDKKIIDSRTHTSAIYALQMESPEAMNEIADNALSAGGKQYAEPKDYGFMTQRTFEDPDGHQWEVFYMDISKFPQPQQQ